MPQNIPSNNVLKTRTAPLTVEEAIQRKAARMKETHDFFRNKTKEAATSGSS